MKTDKNFRLNQPAKRMLALIDDKSDFIFYKKIFIANQVEKNNIKKMTTKAKAAE
jgi:hypothetical protein